MVKWCCDGVKTVPDYPGEKIFCDLYHLRQAALILKVPKAMVQAIDDRLISTSSFLGLGINDMIKIYEDFPEDHHARSEVVGIWAHAHVNGTIPLHASAPAVLNEDLAQDLEAFVNDHRRQFGLEKIIGRMKNTKIDEGWDAEESDHRGADRLQDDRLAKLVSTRV
jgi:hypothetical protein